MESHRLRGRGYAENHEPTCASTKGISVLPDETVFPPWREAVLPKPSRESLAVIPAQCNNVRLPALVILSEPQSRIDVFRFSKDTGSPEQAAFAVGGTPSVH